MIREAHRLSFISEYYFSKKLREVAAMRAAGKPVLNLGIGSPDLPPSEGTVRTLAEYAERTDMHGYQPYTGIPALRSAMAAWYQRTYGVALDPESEILPLIGSKEGIHHIAEAFVDPGDIVLVPDPGYPSYASAVRLAGGEPVSYPLLESRGWEPDGSALTEALLRRAKILFINYPNMPTGARGNGEMLDRLVRMAAEHDVLLVNDNPYSLILQEGAPLSVHQANGSRAVALELNSLSKSHNMAGWRIGMLSGRPEYIRSVLKVKSNIDSGMFRPMQEAAVTALSNSAEWHAEQNAIYARRRSAAEAILTALGCTFDPKQGGMFLWGRVPDRYDDVETLTERVLQEGHVFLTPGFIFGPGGKRYIRISLCSDESTLMEALQRIQKLEL